MQMRIVRNINWNISSYLMSKKKQTVFLISTL